MQRTLVAALAAFTLSVTGLQPLLADYYSGGAILKSWNDNVYFNSGGALLSPMKVTNVNTDDVFMAFCGDFGTTTSEEFRSSDGQEYTISSLSDSYYKEWQKSMIDELFGYTYAVGFNDDGSFNDDVVAKAIQLVIWEILTENISGDDPSRSAFELDKDATNRGSFWLSSTNDGNNYSELIDTTSLFFNALFDDGATWGSLGYSYAEYDMTVYTAVPNSGTSQTLISITRSPGGGGEAHTPEPASMLIFGLGAACGIPMIRRRMKKAKV